MNAHKSRRRFLGLVGAVAAGGVVLAAPATDAEEPKKNYVKLPEFTGTSKKGNLQDALDAAIQTALDSAKGADRMVTWSLKKVSGREGGIAGFNEVTVVIEGTVG